MKLKPLQDTVLLTKYDVARWFMTGILVGLTVAVIIDLTLL